MRTLTIVLSVILGASLPARAQPDAELSALEAFLAQTMQRCGDSPDAQRFAQALRVELSAMPFALPDEQATHTVRCDVSEGKLSLSFTTHEWVLDVSDVPRTARARTLAVAVAETLRLPPPEPRVEPTPSAPPASAPQADAPPPPLGAPAGPAEPIALLRPTAPKPPMVRTGWQVPVTARAMMLGEYTLSLGATLGASFAVTHALRLGAHLGYLTAHHRSAFGSARLHAASLEPSVDLTVLRPSAHSTILVGASARLYRAVVDVDSAWGLNEPTLDAWFALWSLHTGLFTVVSDSVCVFTRVAALKDIAGRRFNAGGKQAMSFYGVGVELALGAAYTF